MNLVITRVFNTERLQTMENRLEILENHVP